ncbi:MAG: TonB C-terminal domain-containing protein [Desulfobulbaceae bacterium]|nr:TonB C-terminal domain-containing protein [Desulfobulbaceae bacterium]
MIGSDHFGSFPTQDLPPKQAKIALGLAVSVHLAILILGILSPYLLTSKPVMPEVYTIDLISVTEMAGEPAATPKAEPAALAPAAPEIMAPPPPPAKAVIKQPVPPPASPPAPKAAPAPLPAPVPAREPAVSLRPIKQKTQRDLSAVESLRQKLHAQQQAASARQEAEKAKQQADKAVSNALSAIRQNIRSQPRPAVATGRSDANAAAAAAGGPGGGVATEEAMKRYHAAVFKRIKEHFVLPDLKNWQPTLQAILVIEIRNDGIVTRNFFEQKSENIFFNQAVSKALAEASPMPPFPPELKESRLEFGLRFRPGDLM